MTNPTIGWKTSEQLCKLLLEEEQELILAIQGSLSKCRFLVQQAFERYDTGNIQEARILMNAALDIECDTTGDCDVLNDISEAWGVDYERDRDPIIV